MMRNAFIGVLVASMATIQASAQVNAPIPHGATPKGARDGMSIRDYRHDGMRGLKVDPDSAGDTYRNALATADCIIELGDRAAKILAEEDERAAIGSDIYNRYGSCARQPNAALSLVIDGAVAERLLAREGAITTSSRALHLDVVEATRFHGDLTAENVSLTSVARCAAVYSPGLALEVLRTEVGSDSEATSLTALFAMTPECGLSGAPAAIPAPVQRGAIALALYRWSHARA